MTRPYCSIVAFVIALGAAVASATLRADEPDFNRDVRPIFAKHCLKCHGPDEHGRQGGLRFDLREAALAPAESGARAIVPAMLGRRSASFGEGIDLVRVSNLAEALDAAIAQG